MHGRRMQMPNYKTIRLREEDYRKMKKIQRLLRKKGTESIDWEELREQDIIEVPEEEEGGDEDDDAGDGDLTWGFLIGLGAAALAYFLLKGGQGKK